MKKLSLILFLSFFIFCCSKTPKFYSKGNFSKKLELGIEDHFVTYYDGEPNQINKLKKITESKFSYYAWKSVKYNQNGTNDINNSSSILSYKTILDDDISNYKFDEASFINQDGNLLINYLFFVDDYRCIYLSLDDKRTANTNQNLYLHFGDDYKLPKNTRHRYLQLNRGYYTIFKDSIFIDFEQNTKMSVLEKIKRNVFKRKKRNKGRHFFLKGIIKGKIIEFEKLSIPNSPSIFYKDGMNTVYTEFDSIFHADSQPIFELVPQNVNALKYEPKYFQLLMGFSLSKEKEKNINLEMHKTILEKDTRISKSSTQPLYRIDSIKYVNMENELFAKRVYYFNYSTYVQSPIDTIYSRRNDSISESLSRSTEHSRSNFLFKNKFTERNCIQTW